MFIRPKLMVYINHSLFNIIDFKLIVIICLYLKHIIIYHHFINIILIYLEQYMF